MNALALLDLPSPTDLPNWARDAALNAVMAYPPERIAAALEGFDELDLPALLGVLGAGEVAA